MREDISTLKTAKDQVLKDLDHWAGGINPERFAIFKKDIHIEHIWKYPLGYLWVETLSETRHVYSETKPYEGELLDDIYTFESPNQVNAWALNMQKPPLDLSDYTYTMPVPNASKKTPCSTCSAEGLVSCNHCDGLGHTLCSDCDGKGKVSCSDCRGTEMITCVHCKGKGKKSIKKSRTWQDDSGVKHKEEYHEDVKCDSCRGTGKVMCEQCTKGFVPCETCHAQGQIPCKHCQATGKTMCPTCNGKKFMLQTLLVNQRYIRKEALHVMGDPEFLTRFRNYPFTYNDASHKVKPTFVKNYDGPISPEDFHIFAPEDYLSQHHFKKEAEGFLKTHTFEPQSKPIQKQRMTFFSSDCLVVQYQFKNQSYDLLIDPLNDAFYTHNNPFETMVLNVLNDAIKAYDQRRYGDAYAYVQAALESTKGTDKESESVLWSTKIKQAFRYHYGIGAGIGLGSIIFFKFLTLMDWPFFLTYVLIPICVIGVLGFFINKVIHLLPLKKDLIRLIIGLVYSLLFYTLVIYLIGGKLLP